VDERTPLEKITGIYHADGSLVGEMRYLVGKIRGTTHCALCEVTHGLVRKKRNFSALEERLPVPVELVHLDERDAELAAFTKDRTPAVVGHTSEGLVMLLGPGQLELDGKVERFAAALERSVESAGLRWPDPVENGSGML